MRDFRAGRLKRLKKLNTSFFQRPESWQANGPVSAKLRLEHSNLKYTVPFFPLGDV